MKNKVILLSLLIFIISPVYAIDYVLEAAKAYNDCLHSGTNCNKFNEYTNAGIKAYAPLKDNSYADRKNYCTLVALRFNTQMTPEDLLDLQRYCQFVY